jgi:hypothetical protein
MNNTVAIIIALTSPLSTFLAACVPIFIMRIKKRNKIQREREAFNISVLNKKIAAYETVLRTFRESYIEAVYGVPKSFDLIENLKIASLYATDELAKNLLQVADELDIMDGEKEHEPIKALFNQCAKGMREEIRAFIEGGAEAKGRAL